MARRRYQQCNHTSKQTTKGKAKAPSLSSLTLSYNSQNDETENGSNNDSDTEYNLSEIDIMGSPKPNSTESEVAPKSILKIKLDTKNKDNKSSVSSENMILELLRRLKSYCWSSNATEPEQEPKPEKHIMLPKNQKKKETGKERFESDNINTRENVVRKIDPRPEKHTSKNDKILDKKQDDANPKLPCQKCRSEIRIAKARKIIKTALKYGIANGLVKKNGNQYVLYSRRELKQMIKTKKHRCVSSDTDDAEISKMVNKLSEEDVRFLYTRPVQIDRSTSQLSDNKSCDSLMSKKVSNSQTDLQSNCKTAASKHSENNAREFKGRIPPSRTKSAPHKLHYSCCKHPSTQKTHNSMTRKRKLSKNCSQNSSCNCVDSSHSCSKKSKSNKYTEDNDSNL